MKLRSYHRPQFGLQRCELVLFGLGSKCGSGIGIGLGVVGVVAAALLLTLLLLARRRSIAAVCIRRPSNQKKQKQNYLLVNQFTSAHKHCY